MSLNSATIHSACRNECTVSIEHDYECQHFKNMAMNEISVVGRGGRKNFFFSPQIGNFWGSFRYRKSAHFVGVSVRISQIHKFSWLIRKSQNSTFLQNIAQLCLRTVLKVVFLTWFYILYKFEFEHYICSEKKYVFVNMRSCKSTKKLGSADRKSTNYNFANHKRRLGPQITNPQGATFAKSPQF